MSAPDRTMLLDPGHPILSIRRQCGLLGLARSSVYRPARIANDDELAIRPEGGVRQDAVALVSHRRSDGDDGQPAACRVRPADQEEREDGEADCGDARDGSRHDRRRSAVLDAPRKSFWALDASAAGPIS
jgi:hypothetical protein